MTKLTNDWKCGQEQGVQLSASELAYVVDKSFYGLGSEHNQIVAVAVAMAESGGWTGAVGDCDIGYSLGLWQIHVPAHKATVSLGGDAFNAYDNAAMAAVVYNSGGFKNWTTYTHDLYLSHMTAATAAWKTKTKPGTVKTTPNTNPAASPAMNVPVVKGATEAVTSTVDALGEIGKGIGKGGKWLGNPHNWLRIAYVGLGGAVVIVGLAKLVGYDAGLSPIGAAAKMSRKPKEGKTDGE